MKRLLSILLLVQPLWAQTASEGSLTTISYSYLFTVGSPTEMVPMVIPMVFRPIQAVTAGITLTWTASTDNVAVTGYLIERCQGAACTNFVQVGTVGAVLTFVDTGLTSQTSYSYRVRATDAAGNLSPYSNIATAVTVDKTPPTAPTGLTATPNP